MPTFEWFIYIPEEGHWPIRYSGSDAGRAKAAYLRWAGRKRLPAGSRIMVQVDGKWKTFGRK
ncbi:MAG: hypothetical protein ACRDQZ_11820 [Mycobacteriales bacterium]